MPPARAHFCELTARWYGGCSSPTKYDLNGTMPATLNNTVGSCGMRLADGTRVWSLAAKKSRKESRSWSAFIDGVISRTSLSTPLACLPSEYCHPAIHRPVPARRSPRVGEFRGSRRATHLGVRRHLPAVELHVHLRLRLQGNPRRARPGAPAGVLQPRRPLRRRRRHRQPHATCRAAHPGTVAIPQEGPYPNEAARATKGSSRRRRTRGRRFTRHDHAGRRRRMHLPQPGRIRRRCRLRTAHRRTGGRRAADGLEAVGVLAGAAAARALDRRVGSRHLTPARMETT